MPQASLKRFRLIHGFRIILVVLTTAVASNYFRWASVHPHEEHSYSKTVEMVPIQKANETIAYRHPNYSVDFPLCLVHIGKAAGSSISCGLGLTYADCEGMPRNKLAHTHFFHMRRNNCPRQTRTYVVTLRNPLTRLQSWFDFEKDIVPGRSLQVQRQVRKQRDMLFRDCFSTFEKLVMEGLIPIVNVTAANSKQMTCTERAWAAVLGIRPFSYHEWYNYEYYWTGIHPQPSAKIYALRTEHLQEDWETLSSEELFRPVNRRKHNPVTNQTPTTFLFENTISRMQLCKALCQEIQYYKRFLLACINLSPKQRQNSLQEVHQYCPEEVSLDIHNCPHLPSFPKMQVPGRQYRSEVKKRLYEIVSSQPDFMLNQAQNFE